MARESEDFIHSRCFARPSSFDGLCWNGVEAAAGRHPIHDSNSAHFGANSRLSLLNADTDSSAK
jgi:hypothetical protein